MTYPESIQFLYSLRLFGTKLGLENTLELAALAGNPHRHLRFIHVAGTNGKGSTCAMLESIYRAAGLRVGLFTSPHLVSFRERMQVNRELISADDVVRLVGVMQGYLHQISPAKHPTFFEVVTILALQYFLEQVCQIVIWETGLGGRLDATNIVTPLASVITNIQLDHERWLGSTLAQIASEKAGIIKPGVPSLTAADAPEALEVIQRMARERRSPLTIVSPAHPHAPPLLHLELPLLGAHQRTNAALAAATVQAVRDQVPVSETAIREGLVHVQWPGRLQRHVMPSGTTVLLDGAHNPAGAETVRQALERYFPGRKPALLLGVMEDKDWRTMCRILAPLAKRFLLVPVQSERTAAPADLERVCSSLAPDVPAQACQSLREALESTREEAFVLVTGSLHLVGEAIEILGLIPEAAGERQLNEWDGRKLGVPQAAP